MCGDGPPLILIHPNPFDHRLWLYQVAHFSTWFTVIAPDLRGYGRSDKVVETYTLDELADDMLAVCRGAGVSKAIVAGVSIGSAVATVMASRNEIAIEALILVGGKSEPKDRGPDDPRVRGYREQGTAYHRQHMEETVSAGFVATDRGQYLLDMFSDTAPGLKADALIRILEARAASDLRPILPSLTMPVLVVNGEYDNALPGGQRTAAAVPNGTHRILPNTGHACCIEDPAGFDALVIEFLSASKLMP